MAAKINLRVESDFTQASADFKEFIGLSDKAEKSAKEFQEAFDTKHINSFLDRQKRLGIAIKATSGETQANKAEYSKLRREIERLIMKGMDPLDDKMKPLVSRFKQLEAEMKDSANATKGATKGFSLLDGVMLGLGAKALNVAQQGFQKVIEFTKESAQAASNAQETFSKFEVVFRDVEDSANATAQSLADDFGLASSTAAELVGNTGDLLTGFGLTAEEALNLSEQTNRLALDLASFTNAQGGAAAVSKALTSAYSGEREALKTYGIVINEAAVQARILENAQKGLVFETEQQAKIQATLQLAMEQSKNAIGDYARTSDSAANVQRTLEEQTKRLKENYGALVLEGLTPVRKAFRDLLSAVNDSIEANRELNDILDVTYGRKDVENTVDGVLQLERGYAEVESRVINLRAAIKANEESNNQFRQNAVAQQKEALEALESQLNATGSRIVAATRLLSISEQQALEDRRSAEALKEQEMTSSNLAMEREAAAKTLEEIAQSQLSKEEKRISFLDQEIIRLAGVRATAKEAGEEYEVIQKLLNEYVAERNLLIELEEKAKEATKDSQRAEIELYFEKNSIAQEWHDAELERIFTEDEARAEAAEKEKQRLEELRALRFEYANATLGLLSAIGDFQSAQGQAELQRLEEAGASEEELAQKKKELARDEAKRQKKLALFEVAINTASAIVEALPNVFLAALAGATGAIQAAAIASQPIPSAQTGTGTPITVPDSARGRNDNVAVMASPGEQVSVTPRGGSGMMQNISVSLEGAVLISYINRKIESGEIRITTDNIQGGIAV